MEADFNATNKIIYGQRMLQTARKYKLMPEEVFSKRKCLSDNGTLIKVLFLRHHPPDKTSSGNQRGRC
jgi:hypothetical protein